MNPMILKWSLTPENQEDSFEKYCPNCGKKVLFIDSRMRRRNVNGKNIYEYAIYKCPKEHTWNKSTRQSKASDNNINPSEKFEEKTDQPFQTLVISECFEMGVEKVEIYLDHVEGRWRIDKLLAERVADLSRTEIQELIEAGLIMINDKKIKPDELLRPSQKITLKVQFFKYKS
jgi:hypothetical protein